METEYINKKEIGLITLGNEMGLFSRLGKIHRLAGVWIKRPSKNVILGLPSIDLFIRNLTIRSIIRVRLYGQLWYKPELRYRLLVTEQQPYQELFCEYTKQRALRK